MAIIYTNQSSEKKRKFSSKKLAKAKLKHQEFLKTMGYTKSKSKYKLEFPDLSVRQTIPMSNNLHVRGGYKTSVFDYKWKSTLNESETTKQEIENKSKRIAPLWNKGGTMYITDQEDPKTLGRKV